MKTIISYGNGLSWVELYPPEIPDASKELELCTQNPNSHYLTDSCRYYFLKGENLILATVCYKDNIIIVHGKNSAVPKIRFRSQVLSLINTLKLTPIDTVASRDFAVLGLFKYRSNWFSTRDLTSGLSFGASLNFNNLRIGRLPDNLRIHGDFSLCNTHLKRLPNNLEVRGTLDLRYNQLLVLPPSINAKEVLHD